MMDPKLGPPLPEEMRAASTKDVWIEFFLGLVPPAALVFAALGSILLGLLLRQKLLGVVLWVRYCCLLLIKS